MLERAKPVKGYQWTPEKAERNNRAAEMLLALWAEQDRLRKPKGGRAELIERAKSYLFKVPPSVGGTGTGEGSRQCYRAAGVCYDGFALNEEECLQALSEWNARCKNKEGQPWPWSESELRHKIQDVAKKGGPRGGLLNWRPENGGAGGNSADGTAAGGQTANGTANGSTAGGPGKGPQKPRRVPTAENTATVDDVIAAGCNLEWLWEGWIQKGVLTAVAALAGTGKTRFCADLVRRIRHGLPWPDGKPMQLPPESKVLWVAADRNHGELVALTRAFEIRDVFLFNAYKDDPLSGTSLDSKEDLIEFKDRILANRPALVVIDTVGSTTDANLSKQEEAKKFYGPLQEIAQRGQCAVLCLTHLNATGHFLGRRVLEKVRIAIRIEQPDPNNPKRKVEVTKSNAPMPPPLGLSMGDCGNEYDDDLPSVAAGLNPGGRSMEASGKCAAWLVDQLKDGPKYVVSILTEGIVTEHFAKGTIYRAKDALGVIQGGEPRKLTWKLPDGDAKE